jgi:hypothetical protein
VSFENNHVELVVPETHKMYAEKAYQDKLKASCSSISARPCASP